ncbi:hypothetical protein LguiA_021692 [Lonicera macranthoides]
MAVTEHTKIRRRCKVAAIVSCLPVCYTLTQIMNPNQASSSSNPRPSSPIKSIYNPSGPFQFSNFKPLLEPLEAIPLLPHELQNVIYEHTLKSRDKDMVLKFLELLIENHGLCFRGLRLHPAYPFCSMFHVHHPHLIPKIALVFLWYLTRAYTISFLFNAPVLLQYIRIATSDPEIRTFYSNIYGRPETFNFITFLSWFKSIDQWMVALQTHYHVYCLVEFRGPLHVPHSDGSNAKIIEWFPTNLAKSIREPYNVNFVIFLQNMCEKNGVDFNKVPEYVKYDDPWKNHDEANPPLFERLFNYAERHNWSYGEFSSDSDAFVGMDSTDEENEGVDVAAELDDLAYNSDGDGDFNDEPNTPIYGGTPDHYWDYDDDGNETD